MTWLICSLGLIATAGVVASGCASSGSSSSDDIDVGMGRLGAGVEDRDDDDDDARTEAEPSVYDAEARDYAPLAVGASWTYETNVLGDRTKGSVQIRIVDKVEGFYRDSAGAEYRHTANGLRDKIRYLIRNPLKVGGKWKATLSAAAVEHYTIESVGQPCDTRAGRFSDCLVVTAYQRRNDRERQHVRYTWVRSVGLASIVVEGEIAGRGRFVQSELSLLQYSLKGRGQPRTGAQRGRRRPQTDAEGAPTEWQN